MSAPHRRHSDATEAAARDAPLTTDAVLVRAVAGLTEEQCGFIRAGYPDNDGLRTCLLQHLRHAINDPRPLMVVFTAADVDHLQSLLREAAWFLREKMGPPALAEDDVRLLREAHATLASPAYAFQDTPAGKYAQTLMRLLVEWAERS